MKYQINTSGYRVFSILPSSVTIQAFRQGIGTDARGPGIMPEFRYSARKDYTLKFLIRMEAAT